MDTRPHDIDEHMPAARRSPRPERGGRRPEPRRRILQPQARRPVAIGVLVLLLLLVAAGAWWYLASRGAGSVKLAPASKEATATVTFAGVFPAESEPGLRNPLGIAVIGERVFVAESDAGVIREFAADGARRGTIALPVTAAGTAAYPVDVAAVGTDKLAVVDTAGERVLVILAGGGGAPLVLGARDAKTAPVQPTSVAAVADGIAVADGADHTVKVYSPAGAYLRTIAGALTPKLGFVGGMALVGGRLYLADSNAGRVVIVDPKTGAQVGTIPERLQLPRGLAAAEGGRLLVVSTFGRSLDVFAGEQLVGSLGPDTAGVDAVARLALPKNVAWMASTSRAYVTDAGDGRVRVYNVTPAKAK